MRRGTTPTYIIELPEGIGSQVADICLTFKQGSMTTLSLHMSSGEIALNGDIASCTLTQEQTNMFSAGSVKRQVKVKFSETDVQTSDIESEDVYDVLHVEDL